MLFLIIAEWWDVGVVVWVFYEVQTCI